MNLREILKQYNIDNEENYSIEGKVIEVDKVNNTVDVEPLDGSPEIFNVKLQSDSGNGFIIYPVKNSTVIVSFLDKDNGFISMYSKVDVYDISTENESLKAILNDLLTAITQLTVTTPTGVSGVPVNLPVFNQIKSRLRNLFK